MTSQLACELIRKLADVREKDHFGSDAFSTGKRMFATVWHENQSANLRLSPELQHHFLSQDGEAFSAIDNAWGRQGWTRVHLQFVAQDQFLAALNAAWAHAPNKGTRLGGAKAKKTRPQGRKSK